MSTDNKDVERFAQELQEQIMEQIRSRYSQTVIDLWQNPKNLRKIENPDGYARVKGICGDSMEMYIRVKDDTIVECTFQTDGCGTTYVCGSMATILSTGKSLIDALDEVTAEAILKRLGGLPEEDIHCAHLSVETLREAIANSFKKAIRTGA